VVLSFAHHRAGWRPGGGFSRNYLVSNRLYLKSVLKRPFSPPSNGDFPGRMAFRRRRIRVLPTKRRFDGVESAFCRQNGDPTPSDWGFFEKMAFRRAGKRRFADKTLIRRRRISVLPTKWRSDAVGLGVFLGK